MSLLRHIPRTREADEAGKQSRHVVRVEGGRRGGLTMHPSGIVLGPSWVSLAVSHPSLLYEITYVTFPDQELCSLVPFSFRLF